MPEKHKISRYYGDLAEKRFLRELARKRNRKALQGYVRAAENRKDWGNIDRDKVVYAAEMMLRRMGEGI